MRTATRKAYSLGCAGLAEGTNANTFQIANILHYAINGLSYRKAVTDNIAFAAETALTAAFTALAAKQTCLFFFFIDSAGAVTAVQSEIRAATTEASYVKKAIDWPSVADKACFGALKVQTNNSATFTPGSTDLGATDVVDTFYNVADDYGTPLTL